MNFGGVRKGANIAFGNKFLSVLSFIDNRSDFCMLGEGRRLCGFIDVIICWVDKVLR